MGFRYGKLMPINMLRWKNKSLTLAVYGLLISVGAFVTAWVVYQVPSDPKNNIFLGLSLQRMILIGSVALAGLLASAISVRSFRDETWAEWTWTFLFGRSFLAGLIRWLAAGIAITGWVIWFTPLYRWESNQDYYLRLHPIIVWLTLAGVLTFVVSGVEEYGFDPQNFLSTLSSNKKILGIALGVMFAFLLVWAFIALTGMGVWVSDGFWYGAGVPVLSLQIVLAMGIGLGVFALERSPFKARFPKWTDLFIFFLIWGVAAYLWAREPLPTSFFAPGPFLPDYELHPFSDAATFDRGSQFALIGQGINNGAYWDRALYMAFLVFMHQLFGQNYEHLMNVQAAIYAVFPALLYLLGRDVFNRSFGVILAALVTMRGVNGIMVSTLIDLANQKHMLTDFPTVIFVAWFALMMVRWLKDPARNYLNAVWAGGVVGLGIMLRTNTLFLLVFAGILVPFVYWRQKLRGAVIGVLILVAMFASTYAWGAYHDKSVFDIYFYRIMIVLKARYPQAAPQLAPEEEPQGNEASPLHVSTVSSTGPRLAEPARVKPVYEFVTIHFLHNIISSVFILPTDDEFHDLWRTARGDFPYWEPYWDGRFAESAHRFLTLNLLLVALGIAAAWKYSRAPGLAPLGIFFFYDLANAFARTSGGRYVVPIDWIILFYFALGLFQVILWGMAFFGLREETAPVAEQVSWSWEPLKKKAPLIVIFFLFAGSLVPVSGHFIPRRYPERSQEELFALLEAQGDIQKMGYDAAELQAAFEQWPELRIVAGRALYPRYFEAGRGIPKNRFPYTAMDFPRIAFTVIGPQGLSYVLLPRADVDYFPNASDVFVLGCGLGANIDALAVVIVDQPNIVYTRRPPVPLQCPVQ